MVRAEACDPVTPDPRRERLRIFYEENRKKLYAYALSLTRNAADAEDAVHSAICAVLKRPALPLALKPYLYRCVRNAAVDGWRKRKSREDAVPHLFAAGNDGVDPETWDRVQTCLYRLTDDQRETIILKTISGFSLRQIAAVRRVSINTAASWYRRGLGKLRTALKEAGE